MGPPPPAHASSQHHSYSPAMVNVVAGGGAGVVETTLTYPLDLARTRIQMQVGGKKGGGNSSSSSSLLGVLRGVVAEGEGGVKRLWRGLLPPLVAEAPRRALKFTANDAYTQALQRGDDQGKLSMGGATLAGTLTGMTEAILHTPFSGVKNRLQAREFMHCRNSWLCVREMVQSEGSSSLYRGFEAYLYRQGLWNGAYFGVIGLVRETWPDPAADGSSNRMWYSFWTGLMAGSCATTVNTPLDLVLTRIQCMRSTGASPIPWCFPFLLSIYREEGFQACFKGLTARLSRAAPGSGILLVTYEAVKGWLLVP